MILRAFVLYLCITTSVVAQPLFTTDFVYESPGVALSPNGKLMVYTEYRSKTGILVRRTDNHAVQSRVAPTYIERSIGKPCHGFVDDSTILIRDFTFLVSYNIHSGNAVDSLENAEFGSWMSPSTFVAIRREGDSRRFFEYNPTTKQQRELFVGVATDRCFSAPQSPFFIRTLPNAKPRVFRKSDLSMVRTLDTSGEDYRAPYAFTADGLSVFAQINDGTIGKVNLSTGAFSSEMSVKAPMNENNRFYISPDEKYLVVIDRQKLILIHLPTTSISETTPIVPNAFLYATWLPDSRRLLVSSSFTVREHNVDDIERGQLLATQCSRFESYNVCRDRSILKSIDGAPPFRVDYDSDDISHLLYPPPFEGLPVGISQRLYGSDTLLGGSESGLAWYSFCDEPWSNALKTVPLKIDYNVSINANRTQVLGLSEDGANVLLIDLSSQNVNTISFSQVGEVYKIRFIANDQKVAIVGMNGALVFDIATNLSTFYSDVTAGPYTNLQQDVFDRSGLRCVLIQGDRKTVRVYRSFPDDYFTVGVENPVKLNVIEDANVSSDGTLVAIEQTDGLMRLLRASDGSEVARRQLPGFFLHFIDPSYVQYDINSRLLTWQNWFGEFTIERWPEQPVSVASTASSEMQNQHGLMVDQERRLSVAIPPHESVSDVMVYDVVGKRRDISTNFVIDTAGNLTCSLQGLESGTFFLFVKTDVNVYSRYVLICR